MEGPKIPQIPDLPDSENLDLRNKGGFLVKYRTDTDTNSMEFVSKHS